MPTAPCPRLDALPGRELAGGLRLARVDTLRARTLGLAWMDDVPPTSALLIPGCRSVHTFGMRFALDLIWVDADEHPLELVRDVPRRRTRGCRRARAVIETRAGAAERFLAALG